MATSGNSSDGSGSGGEEDSESSSHCLLEYTRPTLSSSQGSSTAPQVWEHEEAQCQGNMQEPLGSNPDDTILAALPIEIAADKQLHISSLPHELILRIVRWAVGDHLDIRILGRLARVCKYFYRLSHDPFLWRSICIRQWPSLLTFSKEIVQQTCPLQPPKCWGYKSWREMAIWKPHVLFDGCYLCRISYVRPGEADFGVSYRPMHLVVYYRGIRFNPDGRMSMLTSSSTPNSIVTALGKHASMLPIAYTNVNGIQDVTGQDNSLSSGEGFLHGTYTWCEPDFIDCSLQRPRSEEKAQHTRRLRQTRLFNSDLQVTFKIRFRLTSSKRRLHSMLRWDSYVIHTVNSLTQTGYVTRLDVSSDQFPAFHFSPVRSYTSHVSSKPL